MTGPSDSNNNPKFNLPPQVVKPEESTSSITLPDVFHLGIHLEYLRNIVDSDTGEQLQKRHVQQTLENIDSVLANQNTRGVVSELVSKQQRKIGEPNSPEERISPEQAEDLKKQVTSWIHLFSRDLSNETRIPAATSGVLDIDMLVESPEELFNEEVWEWLDTRPQEDIKEACRSVAVGCATASVMLSLRAVEHCLREWYEQENESLEAAWGRVLDQLMEEYTEEEKRNDTVLTQLSDFPPVLTTLYYLKEKRNEVNHPEESPSPREARRTLLIVTSTITEIYEVMRSKAIDEGYAELEESQGDIPGYRPPEISDTGEEVLEIISELDDGNGVTKEEVIRTATDLDLSESELDNIFQNLLLNGHMYEPEEDKFKPI